MDIEEQQHIEALLKQYRRRLWLLEQRTAIFGINTPVELTIEIEDIQAVIEQLQAQLNGSQQNSLPLSETNGQAVLLTEGKSVDVSPTSDLLSKRVHQPTFSVIGTEIAISRTEELALIIDQAEADLKNINTDIANKEIILAKQEIRLSILTIKLRSLKEMQDQQISSILPHLTSLITIYENIQQRKTVKKTWFGLSSKQVNALTSDEHHRTSICLYFISVCILQIYAEVGDVSNCNFWTKKANRYLEDFVIASTLHLTPEYVYDHGGEEYVERTTTESSRTTKSSQHTYHVERTYITRHEFNASGKHFSEERKDKIKIVELFWIGRALRRSVSHLYQSKADSETITSEAIANIDNISKEMIAIRACLDSFTHPLVQPILDNRLTYLTKEATLNQTILDKIST